MIIGAGLAGLRTAAELRDAGYGEKIIIIGAEKHPPYDRPPLSSALLSAPDPVWLAEDLSIEWPGIANEIHLQVRATGLTPGSPSIVHTDTAGDIAATNVVIATGARAINPWPGTLTLTTLDDAARLRASLAGGAKGVAIIGAGWIGVELAHVLAGAGHAVTLIEAGEHPLADRLGDAAPLVAQWLSNVDVLTGAAVTGVEGTTVHTESVSIDADIVITAVGMRPETSWLDGSGVVRDERGFIPVDGSGRARVVSDAGVTPQVWAVGDVASRENNIFGRIDGGHWFSALRDPAQIAADIAGIEIPADSVPEIFSDQGPHRIVVLGSLHGDETVLRGDIDSGSWVLFHLEGGRLIGAVAANSPRETSLLRRALSRAELLEITAEDLADESVPLRRLLRP